MIVPNSCEICFAEVQLFNTEKHMLWHNSVSHVADTLLISGANTKEAVAVNTERLDIMDEDDKQAD